MKSARAPLAKKAQARVRPRKAPRASAIQQRKIDPAALRVRFWGVRGSLASPGAHSHGTGGNTSCVEVSFGSERVIFDLGTGLRPLGAALASGGDTVRASLFVSHYHWDHIAGLPFFGPAYDPRSQLEFFGASRLGKGLREILAGQMVAPYFPIGLDALRAQIKFTEIAEGSSVQVGPATVRASELHHPGGSMGFRLEANGRTLVYATDFEHGTEADERVVELARGADLLIIDSQYTPEEYAAEGFKSRKGWGHSTYEVVAGLGVRAGVKQIALYHHSPERADSDIERIARLARKIHKGAFAAREGMEIVL